MKKLFLAVLTAFLLLQSCGLSKNIETKEETREERQIERVSTTRPSDTVTVERKYNVVLKDTVIYTKSYDTKTIIRESYDSQGNQKIDCIPEEIREDIEKINEKIDRDFASRKDIKVEIDLSPLIWSIAGLAFVVVLALIVILIMIMQVKKAVPDLVSKTVLSALSELKK